MNDLNGRYAFAERWYSRRLSDAHRAYDAGAITVREYWDMVSDDALVALAYRARIKVRYRQEHYNDRVKESLRSLAEGVPAVSLLSNIPPEELEDLGGLTP